MAMCYSQLWPSCYGYAGNGCGWLQCKECLLQLLPYRLSPRSCECSNSLGVSVDTSIITIQKSRRSIRISQVAGTGSFTHQDFEYLLRNVRFAHDPLRPDVEIYTAIVSVSVHDGVFTSTTAVTSINVLVANTPPAVLIDGMSDASAVMADGQPAIALFRSGTTLTLFEDTAVVQSVSITLTNPSHSEEQIQLSPLNVPSTITVSGDETSIVLTGPASPADFSQALTDSTLSYHYPPMESILGGERPDFTTR